MPFFSGKRKMHLLDLETAERDFIAKIIDDAGAFLEVLRRPIRKVPSLKGKTVVMFFVEPSTRTRVSFELAAKRLSADTVSISKTSSSMEKGETVLDTVKNLERMVFDAVVMRDSKPYSPHFVAKHIDGSVVNAGDGAHEHPTQALLDMATAKRVFGALSSLRVAIIGDISHSRVARSNIWGFSKMGSEVVVCGPPTMIPRFMERLPCKFTYSVEEAVKDADIVMALRIQKERFSDPLFPSEYEYHRFYGIKEDIERFMKKGAIFMHPGPMNRGVEISSRVADGKRSVILDQVQMGVAVRMSVLFNLLSGGR